MVRRPKRLFQDLGEGIADVEQGGNDVIDSIVNSELGQLGVDVEHHVRGGFMGADTMGTDMDINTPHKKRKPNMAAMKRKRSSSRRPLRRRLSKRKPRTTRPRAGIRMKGLKTMIKRIARDSAEPKRHAFGPDQNQIGGFSTQQLVLTNFRIDDIPPILTTDTLTAVTNKFVGREFFLKGARIRGYMYNRGQNATTVRMIVFRTKTRLPGADINEIVAGQRPRFYNPVSGVAATLDAIPALFRYNPKIGPNEALEMIYSKLFQLDSSRFTGAIVNDELDQDPSSGPDDLTHFDVYIPINKIARQQNEAAMSSINDQHILHYVGFYHTALLPNNITSVPPQVFFTGITYFKDT